MSIMVMLKSSQLRIKQYKALSLAKFERITIESEDASADETETPASGNPEQSKVISSLAFWQGCSDGRTFRLHRTVSVYYDSDVYDPKVYKVNATQYFVAESIKSAISYIKQRNFVTKEYPDDKVIDNPRVLTEEEMEKLVWQSSDPDSANFKKGLQYSFKERLQYLIDYHVGLPLIFANTKFMTESKKRGDIK